MALRTPRVDLNAGSASVTFDDAKVKPEQIIKIIEKEGYKAQVERNRSCRAATQTGPVAG